MKPSLWIFVWILIWRRLSSSLSQTLKIGAIFDDEDEKQELAFRSAIRKINSQNDILPQTSLTFEIERIKADNPFEATKSVCKLLTKGVAAIVGPQSKHSASQVQAITSSLTVPHIEFQAKVDGDENEKPTTINIHPVHRVLTRAATDTINYLGWKNMIVLYDDNLAFIRLHTIFQGKGIRGTKMIIRRLNSREKFKEIIKDATITQKVSNILIDCKTENIIPILLVAKEIGALGSFYTYLFTNLDFHTIDFGRIFDGRSRVGAKIWGLSILDPANQMVKKTLREWNKKAKKDGQTPLQDSGMISTGSALVFDSVMLLALSLHKKEKERRTDVIQLSCFKPTRWDAGIDLYHEIKRESFNGLSGLIIFNNKGLREAVDVHIYGATEPKAKKIGHWKNNQTAIEDSAFGGSTSPGSKSGGRGSKKGGKHLTVVMSRKAPFLLVSRNRNITGNDRFSGYSVELMAKLAAAMAEDGFKFEYKILDNKEVGDGSYGTKSEETGEWNGMIKLLLNGTVDMIVADMTITVEREDAVAFTTPFMHLGISTMMRKPEKASPALLAFLDPFEMFVWIYIIVAWIGVSLTLFFVSRISPGEWDNPYPCNQDEDIVENQFTIGNSFWYTIGAFMQQGTELAPKSTSTRVIATVWAAFTLLVISSYTANLAAFMTDQRLKGNINSAEDLAKQTAVQYGTDGTGSTFQFFKDSDIDAYHTIYQTMNANKSNLLKYEPGVERVRAGGYAYFLESVSLEYTMAQYCDIMQVGGLLDTKGYGVATRRDSPLRDIVNHAVLKLSKKNELVSLKRKYWKDRVVPNSSVVCADDEAEDKASETALKIENMIGVFLVIVCGIVIGIFFALGEYFVFKCQKKNRVSGGFCQNFISDVTFALKCWESSSKEVVRATRPPPSPKSNAMTSSHHSAFDDPHADPVIPFRGLIPPSRVNTPYHHDHDEEG